MADTASSPLASIVRRVLDDPGVKNCPDQELLRRFLAGQDAAAFETLLRRHGPMVLDVCRGVLRNEADVEDAFQATFMVLARKAESIRKAASLASWLHGVAYRVARKARADSARRNKHEDRVSQHRPIAGATDDLTWGELRQVVHEELSGLAERHRAPLVLCYLEGKTQDEAAAQLGLAKGTLKGHLERGRALLRARLVRRGFGPAAALFAAAWPAASASAGVPAALADSTIKVAVEFGARGAATAAVPAKVAALTEGVLRAMFLTRLKLSAAALVAACALAAGTFSPSVAGPGGDAALAADPPPGGEKPAKGKDAPKGDKKPEGDLAKLQGAWQAEVRAGDEQHTMRLTVEGRDFTEVQRRKSDGREITTRGQITLDETADPKQMTLRVSSMTSSQGRVPGRIPEEVLAIYKLDNKGLTRRTGLRDRPTEFETDGTGQIVFHRSLEGTWTVVSCQVDEKEQPGEKGRTYTFRGDTLVVKGPPETDLSEGQVYKVEALDSAKDPKEIDLRMPIPNGELYGVYEVDGDRLTLCLTQFGRPKDFGKALASPNDGPKGVRRYVLQRVPETKGAGKVTPDGLRGAWKAVKVDVTGDRDLAEADTPQTWEFAADTIHVTYRDGTALEMSYRLAAAQSSAALEVTYTGRSRSDVDSFRGLRFRSGRGTCVLEGDRLTVDLLRVGGDKVVPGRPVQPPRLVVVLVREKEDAEPDWGEARDGLKARLRPDRRVWKAGDVPTLKADVRYDGKFADLRVGRDGAAHPLIEVDGKPYRPERAGRGVLPAGPFAALPPGGQHDGIPYRLDTAWVPFGLPPGEPPLKLAPGRHTVRVRLEVNNGVAGDKLLQVWSNPVTIDVLDKDGALPGKEPAWGAEAGGACIRLRPVKARWTAGEAPEFHLDLWNRGPGKVDRIPIVGELQVVDARYVPIGPVAAVGANRPVEPGERIDRIRTVRLDDSCVQTGTPKPRLGLAPGKHYVQTTVSVSVGGREFRATSNAVEFVVLPDDETALEALRKLGWKSFEMGDLTMDGKRVTHLNIRGPRKGDMDDVWLWHLRGMTRMQALYLRAGSFTDYGVAHLKDLTKLRDLTLESSHVTDAALEHLAGMTELRRLELVDTHVTDAGLARLRERLPGLKNIIRK